MQTTCYLPHATVIAPHTTSAELTELRSTKKSCWCGAKSYLSFLWMLCVARKLANNFKCVSSRGVCFLCLYIHETGVVHDVAAPSKARRRSYK